MAVTRDSNKSYLSQVKMPSGNTYYFKDVELENAVNGIANTVTQVMHWRGTTTTAIADGSTTKTISIDGSNYEAQQGDVVSYKPSGASQAREFAWNGTSWQEYGSTGSLKALAFKDSASGTVNDYVTGLTKGGANNSGFTGTAATLKFTPDVDVTVTTKSTTNKTATVTTATITSSAPKTYTPSGKVTVPKYSLNKETYSYTPATNQTVAKTVTSVAPGSTAATNEVTYCAVSGEVLSLYHLGYTTGNSIGAGTAVSLLKEASGLTTENADYQLVGTDVRLVTGNIPVPSAYTATVDANESSVSYTPAGTVNIGLQTGDKTITVS